MNSTKTFLKCQYYRAKKKRKKSESKNKIKKILKEKKHDSRFIFCKLAAGCNSKTIVQANH